MSSATDLTARARIRDAALTLFGAKGPGQVSLREIAAEAGVSPALVIHHFGSKDGLRQACDAHVIRLMTAEGDSLAAPRGVAAMLAAPAAVRRYLARAFLDGTPEAAALFDRIVALVAAWLAEGEQAGWVQPTTDAPARAAVYVTWLFAPFVFEAHLGRVLGVADLFDVDTMLHYSRVAAAMLSHGLFTDERAFATLDAVQQRRQAQ